MKRVILNMLDNLENCVRYNVKSRKQKYVQYDYNRVKKEPSALGKRGG